MHVVETPGIRLLLADRLRLLGVLDEPGVFAEGREIVAEGVGGRGPGAAGVLPFGLGRQAIGLARLGREPAAVFHRRVVRDADDRLPLAPEPEGLVGVGGGRPGDGVGRLCSLRLLGEVHPLVLLPPQIHRKGELVVLVPGHLVHAHPEGGDLDLVLRSFVLRPLLLRWRAAHYELAAWDGKHLELQVGAGDRLEIGLHLRRTECPRFILRPEGGRNHGPEHEQDEQGATRRK